MKAARLLVLVVTALLGACSASEQGPSVFAAASLHEALTDAATAWANRGHPMPVLVFAASGTLARQIENGAPADIFISADQKWMDALASAGAIRPDSRLDLFANQLVAVGPTDRHPPYAEVLAGEGRVAIGDPDYVPAGSYARQALRAEGDWDRLGARVVRTDNVRVALALAARGEVDAAIVYKSDAAESPRVGVLRTFPGNTHDPIVYPAALTQRASPDAAAFLRFLQGPEAKALFAQRGFGRP
jgi:molybdate transport system substrate-binding protein